MKNIILIGMPGSGKSTIGQILAKRLALNFLDTDQILEQREGAKLQTLVDRLGVEGFLDLEQSAILSVDCGGFVIAPGGSAVLRPAMMAHLKSLGTVVYLEVPLPELLQRVSNLSTRGIAMEPHEDLPSIMAKRAPLFPRYADLTLAVAPGESPQEIVDHLILSLPSPN